MRVGGYIVLALAVWNVIEAIVASQLFHLEQNLATTLGRAVFIAGLGAAMLQGSEAARKVVLVILFLAFLGLGGILAGLVLEGMGHLWPIFGASAASILGVFVLVLSRQPSTGVLVTSLGLVASGWVGSVLAAVFLVGAPDLGTLNMIRQWSSDQRTLEDADKGVSFSVPPRWEVLKPGSPVASDNALLTMASTEVIAFAYLYGEPSTAADPNGYLDRVVEDLAKRQAFQEVERAHTTVDRTPARRLKASFKVEGAVMHAYVTCWQDGDTFFRIFLFGPAAVDRQLSADLRTMEAAVKFSAPWQTFMREQAPVVRTTCPLLSDKAIVSVARTLPKGSLPDKFCAEGYRLAFKGLPLLDSSSAERLRTLMRTFFDAVPKGRLTAFGQIVERVRAGHATSDAEDVALSEIARAAIATLSPPVQEELRGHLGMAIDMGRFQSIPGAGF